MGWEGERWYDFRITAFLDDVIFQDPEDAWDDLESSSPWTI
jgi:hypothetical protein